MPFSYRDPKFSDGSDVFPNLSHTFGIVPSTVSVHKLRNFQGEVIVFRVLEDGRVRRGNKIYTRDQAKSQYSYLLQCNWTKV